MILTALSHYDGDTNTRFGDCILLQDGDSLIVYDCGHKRHAEVVGRFLENNKNIRQVHIVVSHNDSDHTSGIFDLMEYLFANYYNVTLYSSLYLKSVKKVLKILDDRRRTLTATKKHILETFDNIRDIVNKAQEYGFSIMDATVGRKVSSGIIVGPTEEEFVETVAHAIEDGEVSKTEGETVMNAASVQLKCKLGNADTVLLCGDASPSYLHNLDGYNLIQLPHHGKFDSAIEIFNILKDPYNKNYLISDNTGSGANSGGSDKLVEYMRNECFSPAFNTKNSVVTLPNKSYESATYKTSHGVKLHDMDFKL